MEYVAGFLALLVLWAAYAVFTGARNPWGLVIGADGRASTSKLQWLVWTVVVLFSYVAIYTARARVDQFESLNEIPRNVLIALGLSATTMATAKAITVAYVTKGQVTKPPADQPAGGGAGTATGPGAVFEDDAGYPELSKIQMIAWTAVAVAIYLITVVDTIDDIHDWGDCHGEAASTECTLDQEASEGPVPGLPDIDAALMVLMGLAQGAYLGKKLVTTETPRLFGITPSQGPPGTVVTLSGQSLGDQAGGQLTIDGVPVSPEQLVWQDTSIAFAIPATQPSGAAWEPPRLIAIGAAVGGQTAVSPQPFTVTAAPTPLLLGIEPTEGPPVTTVAKLTGQSLGAQAGQLTIDGVPVSAPPQLMWLDTSIAFVIPETHPSGTAWAPPQQIQIGATTVSGQVVGPQPFTITA